ncbi:helix-turn-helix domain-containing protein [Hymenobacter sp.]|uniref:helix-turn-helix domain-containing protein n=1 Tax=Hymenobacter sp. TaxID=1898978 RepID=UPI002EDB21AE
MVDRIRQILSARQLTPTQFADTIGVARPIVSHILSGRNKPSLEVVQKIIAAFPKLSLSWLLSGTGTMEAKETASTALDASAAAPTARRGGAKASEAARPVPGKVKTLSDTAVLGVSAPEAPIETDAASSLLQEAPSLPLFPTSATVPYPSGPTNSASNNPAHAAMNMVSVAPEPTSGNPAAATKAAAAAVAAAAIPAATSTAAASIAQPFAEPGKVIRRIVIFYQDNTFTDYQPDSK